MWRCGIVDQSDESRILVLTVHWSFLAKVRYKATFQDHDQWLIYLTRYYAPFMFLFSPEAVVPNVWTCRKPDLCADNDLLGISKLCDSFKLNPNEPLWIAPRKPKPTNSARTMFRLGATTLQGDARHPEGDGEGAAEIWDLCHLHLASLLSSRLIQPQVSQDMLCCRRYVSRYSSTNMVSHHTFTWWWPNSPFHAHYMLCCMPFATQLTSGARVKLVDVLRL